MIKFNDPFDCHPEIDFSQCYSEQSWKRICGMVGVPPENIVQERPKMVELLERNTIQHTDRLNDKLAVLCLSRDPLNLLMWVHYASSHTGFVTEFSIPINPQQSPTEDLLCLAMLFRVEYCKNKPIVDNKSSILTQYAITKGRDWRYEQEERVIDFDRGEGVHPYDRRQVLKSVIAGMRMNGTDFATLKNAVDVMNEELGIHVTVHKAQPVPGEFALFVPGKFNPLCHTIYFRI